MNEYQHLKDFLAPGFGDLPAVSFTVEATTALIVVLEDPLAPGVFVKAGRTFGGVQVRQVAQAL